MNPTPAALSTWACATNSADAATMVQGKVTVPDRLVAPGTSLANMAKGTPAAQDLCQRLTHTIRLDPEDADRGRVDARDRAVLVGRDHPLVHAGQNVAGEELDLAERRLPANWRCWSHRVAIVQSTRTTRAIVRTMIRVPTSRCNERMSAVDTGRDPAGQPGAEQAVLFENLVHGGQAQNRRQHQRGEHHRRRTGNSGVNFGGLDAKHGRTLPPSGTYNQNRRQRGDDHDAVRTYQNSLRQRRGRRPRYRSRTIRPAGPSTPDSACAISRPEPANSADAASSCRSSGPRTQAFSRPIHSVMLLTDDLGSGCVNRWRVRRGRRATCVGRPDPTH